MQEGQAPLRGASPWLQGGLAPLRGASPWLLLALVALTACATTEPPQTNSAAERSDINVGRDECAIDGAALVFLRTRLQVQPGAIVGVQAREDLWMNCRVVQDARDCAGPNPRVAGHSLRGCGWEAAGGVVLLEPAQVDQLAHTDDPTDEGEAQRPRADTHGAAQAAGITSGEVLGLGRAFRGGDGSALLEVETISGRAFQLHLQRDGQGHWTVSSAAEVN